MPIIALTAHAYQDDAARCMEAGMDAFLSKPVRSEELIELVERLTATPGPLPSAPDVSSIAAAETAAPQAAATVFSYDDALKHCLGNPELLQDIIEFLFEEASPLLEEAREGLRRADAEKVGRAAHRLKGTVIHLGAPAAKEALRRVEEMGFSRDLSDAEAALDDAQAQIDLLEQAVASHRRKPSPARSTTLS